MRLFHKVVFFSEGKPCGALHLIANKIILFNTKGKLKPGGSQSHRVRDFEAHASLANSCATVFSSLEQWLNPMWSKACVGMKKSTITAENGLQNLQKFIMPTVRTRKRAFVRDVTLLVQT
jgi:hypothetical protein